MFQTLALIKCRRSVRNVHVSLSVIHADKFHNTSIDYPIRNWAKTIFTLSHSFFRAHFAPATRVSFVIGPLKHLRELRLAWISVEFVLPFRQ